MVGKQTFRATTLAIDELGADIMLTRREQPEITVGQRLHKRLALQRDVLAWHQERQGTSQACTTRQGDHDPVLPEWSPHALGRSGRVAIIGPSPTVDAIRHGNQLGWSRAERLLSDTLRHAGITRDQVTWINACWCWPQLGAKDTRPPTPAEVADWRSWTLAALDAADVDRVLLHGAHAVRLWRSDLQVSTLTSGLYLWQHKWFVHAIPHASSALRQDGLPLTEWTRYVVELADAVTEGTGLEGIRTTCIKCGHAIYAWDADAVPYCKDHLQRGLTSREKARKQTDPNQGVLL